MKQKKKVVKNLNSDLMEVDSGVATKITPKEKFGDFGTMNSVLDQLSS